MGRSALDERQAIAIRAAARGPLSSALDPILVRAARVSSPCPGNAT